MRPESEFEIQIHELIDPSELERPVSEQIHTEQLRQARITFNAAIIVGILGCAIILLGVGFFLFSDANKIGKGFTVGAGIILDVMSFFLIKFHRETNFRLDDIRNDENVFRLVDEIVDQGKRDDAILNLVKSRKTLVKR